MLLFHHLVQARPAGPLNALAYIFQTADLIQIRQTDFKNTSGKSPWIPHTVPCAAPCQRARKKQIKADMLILIRMDEIKYEMILFTKMS